MELSGGRVTLDEPPDTIVHGNIDELIRLFSNILDNAVKYGPPKGTIHVSLRPDSDRHVIVDIHDEGGGIPPESLAHLFDRFYRVDPSRSQKTGGAGLGLAIARAIARRHRGDISISSDPGHGTLVRTRLARL